MKKLFALLLLMAGVPAGARVISYAPYTNVDATPAVQRRTNRHFVLLEYTSPRQAVLYDAKGEEEPRVLWTATNGALYAGAAREDESGEIAVFVQTSAGGMLTLDRGATWKSFALPTATALMTPYANWPEAGGPFVHARGGALRIGTRAMPFVFEAGGRIYGITRDGELKTLLAIPASLLGSSRDGSKFLALVNGTTLVSVDTFGNVGFIGQIPLYSYVGYEGWITPDGGAYVEVLDYYGYDSLTYVERGVTKPLGNVAFSVPSADYAGAWIVNRGSASTTLSFHSPSSGTAVQWVDKNAPQVEALIAGDSGKTLLVQVHRPRVSLDQAQFKDPALAVWNAGDPLPPQAYDELFLAETSSKAFVHVDPDTVGSGDPFVFDSGIPRPSGGIISPAPAPAPPSAGGGDVVQEWGVVRGSLAQRLVLPGAAHAPGAYGTFWRTDATLYNPSTADARITLRYSTDGREASLTLAPREIRTVPDVLQTLFGVASGGGALFITPESGAAINVAARTYTDAPNGTLGYSMNAIDAYAAFNARFPATFAAALLGSNYRTNVVLTDVSGRSSEAMFTAWSGGFGWSAQQSFATSEYGQQQINRLGDALKIPANAAALIVQPMRGEVLAGAVAIDNVTNDATYFPPDIAASVVRMFPAVVHVDEDGGAATRTDVYVFNSSTSSKTVYLQPTMWNGAPVAAQWFTLQGHEVRVFSDVLWQTFRRTGTARMRLWSGGSTTDPAIRATARTYRADANGGTTGFLMPPLNSFQSGAPGDTLEILGMSLRKDLIPSLGLVDTTRCDSCGLASHAVVEIIASGGKTLATFEVQAPASGGTLVSTPFAGLPQTGEPVLVRVTVIAGMIGVYGTMTDVGTGDPAYLPANLAAKQ